MLLSEARCDCLWVIKSIEAGMRLFNRLASMGICEGTVIKVIRNSPGGPVIIEAGGSRFAIGRGMAIKIVVEKAV
ncbi:MAG TPA: FeoA family protein [bacterium]|nr:FeoA family protein [bacterium]